jgi:molybdate transport system substrate-binding protein
MIKKSRVMALGATVIFGIFVSPRWTTGAVAAEIKVLSSNVFTGVLDEIGTSFERSAGHKLTIVYATAGMIRNRVQAGEIGDVTILPRPMMDEILRQGRIASGSIVDVARSAVGVAVRSGAPKPDISSVDAFKRSILAASSVSYPDPKRGGATGVLSTRILQQLGMTDELKSKTKFPPVGQFAVDVVARGDAEIAIAQPMEVLNQPGVRLVGLLPPQLQDTPNFTFCAGILALAKETEAAKALIQFLTGPAAASVLKAKGMSPGDARPGS